MSVLVIGSTGIGDRGTGRRSGRAGGLFTRILRATVIVLFAVAVPLATGQFTSQALGGEGDAAGAAGGDPLTAERPVLDRSDIQRLLDAETSDIPALPAPSALQVESRPSAVPASERPQDELGDTGLWQFSVPSIGVTAQMTSLGVDVAGVMQVPNDGTTVGWYRFSALPGQAGNAVVAAHVDYRGRPAVFHGLGSLEVGAHVVVQAGSNVLTYSVDGVRLVSSVAADVGGIVGGREGPPTMTLITCGGTWDRALRDYDHRVIVTASLIRAEEAS